MNRGTVILLLFMTVIGMDACRSHKTSATAPVPVANTAFYTSCYPIESIFVPSCKIEISDAGKSHTLSGSVYIRPDSICYFRGKLMVEVVRGVVYRDSFVMINYVDRICYRGKNEYLQKVTGYPVNPESLMMLFTADRCEDTYRNKLNFVAVAGSSNRIVMQGKNRSLLEMNINTDNQTIESVTLHNSQQQKKLFSATYNSYYHYPQFALPAVFDISTHNGRSPIRIKADFQQILFDQPQQVRVSVPSRYRVVVLQ
jgi:hypothetical protein